MQHFLIKKKSFVKKMREKANDELSAKKGFPQLVFFKYEIWEELFFYLFEDQ